MGGGERSRNRSVRKRMSAGQTDYGEPSFGTSQHRLRKIDACDAIGGKILIQQNACVDFEDSTSSAPGCNY